MDFPTPKHEVIVKIATQTAIGTSIWIYYTSNDAAETVRSVANKFGRLYLREGDDKRDVLYVLPNFDPLEVKAYLESLATPPIEITKTTITPQEFLTKIGLPNWHELMPEEIEALKTIIERARSVPEPPPLSEAEESLYPDLNDLDDDKDN